MYTLEKKKAEMGIQKKREILLVHKNDDANKNKSINYKESSKPSSFIFILLVYVCIQWNDLTQCRVIQLL